MRRLQNVLTAKNKQVFNLMIAFVLMVITRKQIVLLVNPIAQVYYSFMKYLECDPACLRCYDGSPNNCI